MIGALEQHFTMPQTFNAVTIDVVAASKMWQLEGFDNVDAQVTSLTGLEVPKANGFSEADGQALVWLGRDRYIWITDVAEVASENGMYATDQSQSKTQIRITGTDAKALLARGLQLDLADECFPVGTASTSHINHIGVTVLRLADVDGQPNYEVWVMRGFAVSLMEFLTASAATLR